MLMLESIYVLYAENMLRGFINTKDDYYAAKVLDEILMNMTNVKDVRELVQELSYRCSRVIVVMPGQGIEKVQSISIEGADCVVIVDSSVDYIVSVGLVDRFRDLENVILVTDLDADIQSLSAFCENIRPILIVHAHGDNVTRLEIIKKLNYCEVCGTCQVDYDCFRFVRPCPGFTDGDRALYIASLISSRIDIVGFSKDTTYSLKGLTHVKKIKLEIFEHFLNELRVDRLCMFIY